MSALEQFLPSLLLQNDPETLVDVAWELETAGRSTRKVVEATRKLEEASRLYAAALQAQPENLQVW